MYNDHQSPVKHLLRAVLLLSYFTLLALLLESIRPCPSKPIPFYLKSRFNSKFYLCRYLSFSQDLITFVIPKFLSPKNFLKRDVQIRYVGLLLTDDPVELISNTRIFLCQYKNILKQINFSEQQFKILIDIQKKKCIKCLLTRSFSLKHSKKLYAMYLTVKDLYSSYENFFSIMYFLFYLYNL